MAGLRHYVLLFDLGISC